MDSIPGSGRTPIEENGKPFQYSCLENPTDKGAWWAEVQRVAKSRTQLSTNNMDKCTVCDTFFFSFFSLVFFKIQPGMVTMTITFFYLDTWLAGS